MSLVETSFQQNAGLDFISVIFFFKTSPKGFCGTVLLFKISENFLRGITAISFCTGGCNFTEDELFRIYSI